MNNKDLSVQLLLLCSLLWMQWHKCFILLFHQFFLLFFPSVFSSLTVNTPTLTLHYKFQTYAYIVQCTVYRVHTFKVPIELIESFRVYTNWKKLNSNRIKNFITKYRASFSACDIRWALSIDNIIIEHHSHTVEINAKQWSHGNISFRRIQFSIERNEMRKMVFGSGSKDVM